VGVAIPPAIAMGKLTVNLHIDLATPARSRPISVVEI
jgi:hypothetical protein